jgi:hypothetical protein
MKFTPVGQEAYNNKIMIIHLYIYMYLTTGDQGQLQPSTKTRKTTDRDIVEVNNIIKSRDDVRDKKDNIKTGSECTYET